MIGQRDKTFRLGPPEGNLITKDQVRDLPHPQSITLRDYLTVDPTC